MIQNNAAYVVPAMSPLQAVTNDPNTCWQGRRTAGSRKLLTIVRVEHDSDSSEHHYVLLEGAEAQPIGQWGSRIAPFTGDGEAELAAFIEMVTRNLGAVAVGQSSAIQQAA